tara:strand:+ start:38 stop:457 length:420 start_codon:yes stop_codon:yes gene_type:complete
MLILNISLLIMTTFNYWDDEYYYPTCKKCGNIFNTRARWCSKKCWTDERDEREKEKFNRQNNCFNIFGDTNNIDMDIEREPNVDKLLYDILRLNPPKTKEEVKQQYHRLALKYHPDKSGDADTFISIKNAYDKLYNKLE